VSENTHVSRLPKKIRDLTWPKKIIYFQRDGVGSVSPCSLSLSLSLNLSISIYLFILRCGHAGIMFTKR
jgi:hypothetical protein